MFVLLVLLYLVAVARAARLITADKITEGLRFKICRVVRDADGLITEVGRARLLYFVTCPWCTSIYLAAGLGAAVVWAPDAKLTWLAVLTLAASEVAGMAAGVEDRLDRDCCITDADR